MLSFIFGGFAQINEEAIPDGIMFKKDKRQVVGTSATTTSDTLTTSSTPLTTSTPSSIPPLTTSSSSSTESTPSEITSSTPSDTSPAVVQTSSSNVVSSITSDTTTATTPSSSAAAVSSSSSSSSDTSTTSTSTPTPTSTSDSSDIIGLGSTTINRSTLSTPTIITSALVAEETIASSYTSVWTSDGQVHSSVVMTSRVIATTTGSAVATISPILQTGSGGNGSALSSSSQKIIGGVVGGVGGALVIGGLAFAVWRIWGRKRRNHANDDLLDSREDSLRREKRSSSRPFGNSIDEYHPQPVNTSSNF